MFDEAHLSHTAREYRKTMQALGALMKSRPPVVLMTATCGPTMEGPMLQNLELGKMTTIRSTTNRAELMYSVFPSEPIADHKIAGAVEQWYNTNLRDRLRLSTS